MKNYNRGEYISKAFEKFNNNHSSFINKNVWNTPQQNSVAEIGKLTVVEMAGELLKQAGNIGPAPLDIAVAVV